MSENLRVTHFPGVMHYTVHRGRLRNPSLEDFADVYRNFVAVLKLANHYPPTDGSLRDAEPDGHGLFMLIDWLREVAEDLDDEYLVAALAANEAEDGEDVSEAGPAPAPQEPAS